MLFSYLLVNLLTIKAFVSCTTAFTSTTSTSSPSATDTLSSQQTPVPGFTPLDRPQCVLQNADPNFTLEVERMLVDLRGDNTLPGEFRHFNNPVGGSSVWLVTGSGCELRLTPRLRQSQAIALPKPVIERFWALGLKEAIRNIYFECVRYGQVGGAQVWEFRESESEPLVDIEVAILRMHR